MLLPLPYLGATITWTTRCYDQDCRNEAQQPAAGRERKWPGGPLLYMTMVRPLHLLCLGYCTYLYRGAGLGHAGLDPVRSIPLAGV